MSRGGRDYGSAIGPAALLGAVVLGLLLFVFLLNVHRAPIRIEVAKPAQVQHPGAACPGPCYTVNVSNLGGSAGNVMCQIDPPGVFVSGGGGRSYMGLTPLQPDQSWVLFVRVVSNSIPAPPPVVSCSPF